MQGSLVTASNARRWRAVAALLALTAAAACSAQDQTHVAPPHLLPAVAPTATETPPEGVFSFADAHVAASPGGDKGASGGDRDAGATRDERDQSEPEGASCYGTPDVPFFADAPVFCGDHCKVCPQLVAGGRVLAYFMSEVPDCECSRPDSRSELDAALGTAPDGCRLRGSYLTPAQAVASCFADGAACRVCAQSGASEDAATSWGVVAAECECPALQEDGICGSQTDLTEAQAIAACAGLTDCHVCAQEMTRAGETRSWMAHACGCPAPYLG